MIVSDHGTRRLHNTRTLEVFRGVLSLASIGLQTLEPWHASWDSIVDLTTAVTTQSKGPLRVPYFSPDTAVRD